MSYVTCFVFIAMGEAKTKMGAKHAAVKCAFQTISDAAEKGQNLEQVSCDILLVCQKMYSQCYWNPVLKLIFFKLVVFFTT